MPAREADVRRAIPRWTVAAAAALAPIAVALHAQQTTFTRQTPSLTFRSAANYVEVDAAVTDDVGRAVPDLTCDDFEVSEDGKPQALNVCAYVNLPMPAAVTAPAAAGTGTQTKAAASAHVVPDVASNEHALDGRVYAIVLDSFHVSMYRSSAVKAQARKFVDEYLSDNDWAAVVIVGQPTAGQEFTADRRLLDAAIDRFLAQGLPSETQTAAADARFLDEQHLPFDPGPATDTNRQVRAFMVRESLESIERLSDELARLNGRRKALVLFSEGVSVNPDQSGAGSDDDRLGIQHAPASDVSRLSPITTSAPDQQMVLSAQAAMIAAATRANVSIYSFDPRGMTTGSEDTVLLGEMTDPAGSASGRLYVNNHMAEDLRQETRREQDSLRVYAEQTGGLAFVDQNDVDAGFGRIVEDNSAYYLLGYSSPDPKHDGRFHRTTVKVKRPGLHVRTRNGYYGPEDAADRKARTDPVADALSSPAPISGLGMRASASVVTERLAAATVHLTVEFSGADLALKSSGGLFTNDIDVEYVALNMKGEQKAGGHDIAHLQLRPETKDTLPQTGVRYVTEFDVPPGRYQVRVGARDHLGGKTGSVFCDLDVPDLSVVPLAMSDLLLTSAAATRTPTPRSVSTIGDLLPSPATTARTFAAGDTLTAAVSVYDTDTRGHQVGLTATVRSDAGAGVFAKDDQRPASALAPDKGGYAWVVSVPLAGLAPGRYVLAVEARSSLSGVAPVQRETVFEIRK